MRRLEADRRTDRRDAKALRLLRQALSSETKILLADLRQQDDLAADQGEKRQTARRGRTMKRLAALFIFYAGPSLAHDQWADGTPVPRWIKSSCCGERDAHRLRPDQVHKGKGVWLVDGFGAIPDAAALPSQDGDYWLFYGYLAGEPALRCFFVPMTF